MESPITPVAAIAFAGSERLAEGPLAEVAARVKSYVDGDAAAVVVVLDALTSRTVELDLRGTVEDVVARIAQSAEPAPEAPRAPGRPKLGVVPREVTLLPRHWEWLGSQTGGASVTLRKLVEKARLEGTLDDRIREGREAAYRFMTTMAGNEPGYEEATRALFAGDRERFELMTSPWPAGVREHLHGLAERAFAS